jgi:hypothetical protein
MGETRPYEHSVNTGMDCIIIGTHMLTPVGSSVWPSAVSGLTSVLDPDGVLQAAVNMGRHRYTEDNVVTYWEMVMKDDESVISLFC